MVLVYLVASAVSIHTSTLCSFLLCVRLCVCVCLRACVNERNSAWLSRLNNFSLTWNIQPAPARSIMMRLVNWVKMWKVNYVRISCYTTNGWKIPPSPTSSSPHPLTKKLLIISNLCILKWIDLASQIYIIFPFGFLGLSFIMATARAQL